MCNHHRCRDPPGPWSFAATWTSKRDGLAGQTRRLSPRIARKDGDSCDDDEMFPDADNILPDGDGAAHEDEMAEEETAAESMLGNHALQVCLRVVATFVCVKAGLHPWSSSQCVVA